MEARVDVRGTTVMVVVIVTVMVTGAVGVVRIVGIVKAGGDLREV